MSSDERKILRWTKQLARVRFTAQDVDRAMSGVRNVLDQEAQANSAGTVHQPTLRPVPEASYGSAVEAPRGASKSSIQRRIGRFIMNRPGRAVAASIVVLVGVATLWIVLGRGASVAFADVLQQIREIRTVRYKQTLTCSIMGEPPSTTTSEVLVADRYRSRSTWSNGHIVISDGTPGNSRTLSLIPQKKIATFMHRTGVEESEKLNLLDRVLNLDAHQAKAIGQKEIDGLLADGFRVDTEERNSSFWIDPQTRLPVRIEEATMPGCTPSMHIVMADFQWNVAVDASLVSMTPPAEYEQSDISVDGSTPTEKDLAIGLKAFAEFNEDRFPDEFSMRGMTEAMQKALGAKKDTLSHADRMRIAQRLMPFARAIPIAGNPTIGQDWHYAGKGVLLGQAGTPILWYRPKDSPTYRVIYADLTVANVQPADLPTVPSVTIQPFPMPPAATQSQPAASHEK